MKGSCGGHGWPCVLQRGALGILPAREGLGNDPSNLCGKYLREHTMDKLRVGVIGTGMIGKHHLNAYKDMADAEVIAVADIRQEEADKVAAEHGIGKVFTDYHDLLAL